MVEKLVWTPEKKSDQSRWVRGNPMGQERQAAPETLWGILHQRSDPATPDPSFLGPLL